MGWLSGKKAKEPSVCNSNGFKLSECPGCGLDLKNWHQKERDPLATERCPRCNTVLRKPAGCGGCGSCGTCSH